MDASKVHPIVEISTMLDWNFYSIYSAPQRHQPQDETWIEIEKW
jgi:hypothetical protein